MYLLAISYLLLNTTTTAVCINSFFCNEHYVLALLETERYYFFSDPAGDTTKYLRRLPPVCASVFRVIFVICPVQCISLYPTFSKFPLLTFLENCNTFLYILYDFTNLFLYIFTGWYQYLQIKPILLCVNVASAIIFIYRIAILFSP